MTMNGNQTLPNLRSAFVSLYDNALSRPYLILFGHKVYQRFAIVGNARTGSNYLLDGLKRSNSIRMYHEIFADHNRKIGENFEKTFSALYQNESRTTKIVGFKLFYNHLTEEEWKKFLSYKDFKIIHLTRLNRLRTLVSLEIAFQTGQWAKSVNASGKQLTEKRVFLDASRLVRRLEQIEENEVLTRSRFSERKILEVVYEELIKNPVETFQSIGKYLGVNDIDPSRIRLTKQNPESLRQLIINYDEVHLLLKSTRFAEYLDG